MSFIKRIIGPDEKLIGLSYAHWIYGAKGILWLGVLALAGSYFDSHATYFLSYTMGSARPEAVEVIGSSLFWIPTGMGIAMCLVYMSMILSTEVALTSKRIIHKRGIILVSVKEVDLEEIKAAHVNNGWLGRFLNYGYVIFDARFVTGMDLPAIGSPYRFVKALNDTRSRLKEDSMTVVLETVTDAVKQEAAAQSQPKKLAVKKKTAKSTSSQEIPGAPRPVIFDNALLQREKRLRQKIKDNFSGTTH